VSLKLAVKVAPPNRIMSWVEGAQKRAAGYVFGPVKSHVTVENPRSRSVQRKVSAVVSVSVPGV
jgi:hypothetical protein